MAITITTFGKGDTVEDMQAAVGADAAVVDDSKQEQGKEAPPAKDKEGEKPAGTDKKETPDDKKGADQQAADDKAAAGKDGDTDETKLPSWASKLIKDLRKDRRDARQQIAELEEDRAETRPGKTAPPDKDGKPESYTGVPKPTIAEFRDHPEKYDDPYASHAEAIGEWLANEKIAKLEVERKQREADAEEAEVNSEFAANAEKAKELYDDYQDVVSSARVQITEVMDQACKRSEVGPHIFYRWAKNPKEAKAIAAMPLVKQAVAVGRIEVLVEAELEALKKKTEKPAAKADDEKKPEDDRKTKPAANASSKAPEPPARLDPGTNTKQTYREVAGPEDSNAVNLTVSVDRYEKARRSNKDS